MAAPRTVSDPRSLIPQAFIPFAEEACRPRLTGADPGLDLASVEYRQRHMGQIRLLSLD